MLAFYTSKKDHINVFPDESPVFSTVLGAVHALADNRIPNAA